jgi:dihydroflavonol-4-reductase
MQAFVTGSTGLVGNNLVRALRTQGYHVKALARSRDKAQRVLGDTGAEIVLGDMDDVKAFGAALEGSDVLFHAAAYFREAFQPGKDHWATLKRINIDNTLVLLDEAERRGIKQVIYVSSGGWVGEYPDGRPGDEDAPPDPIVRTDLYFRSKLESEQAIASWLATHPLSVVSILPGWIMGPGDVAPTSSGQIVLQLLARKMPALPAGGFSTVDVRDVVQGMIAAVDRGQRGRRYIVGGTFYTLHQLAQMISHLTGIAAPRLTLPYTMGLAYGWASQTVAHLLGRPAFATVSGIRAMHAGVRLSSARAEHELGITFRPIEDTLRDTIAWFVDHRYTTVSPRLALSPRP